MVCSQRKKLDVVEVYYMCVTVTLKKINFSQIIAFN